jgi:hypothetical protein
VQKWQEDLIGGLKKNELNVIASGRKLGKSFIEVEPQYHSYLQYLTDKQDEFYNDMKKKGWHRVLLEPSKDNGSVYENWVTCVKAEEARAWQEKNCIGKYSDLVGQFWFEKETEAMMFSLTF